ncbi:hypothetical protein [Pedobacter endophyticus]|uniref:Uncharacterized protein n=1 Tax=Pedobacter endophyticus TaxID=2789740 RepID=A0A7U3Q545_9SPHI|nr:hypothetical protein [Pedobacter endophyticus]QPH38773.1 hypothetical protein IZT61_17115 [Pedobacter endophyticus]
MKIFNLQPITVTKYIFNEAHLAESHNGHSYSSGFEFKCSVVDSLKTMVISFDILSTVGGVEWEETIISSDDPNGWTVELHGVEVEEDAGDILVSYKSSCRFNLENQGLDADIKSMTDFLGEYYLHTQKFLNQYGFESLEAQEEEMRMNYTLRADALIAIENLRGANMYEF